MKLPDLPCACANLRRAARAVTRFYDRELAATGLELTQLTLLMTLDVTGETSQKHLASVLAMDSTTLTRTLRSLIQHDWVKAGTGDDRRKKLLSLTAAGRRKLIQAQPHWERAQQALRAKLGNETWQHMAGLLSQLTAAAAEE